MFTRRFVGLVALFITMPTPVLASDDIIVPDFNTRLVYKLAEMLGVDPPEVIMIREVSSVSLREWFKQRGIMHCIMQGHTGLPEQWVKRCLSLANANYVVLGRWINLSVQYYSVELMPHVGIRTKIHEFGHWYLKYHVEGNFNEKEIETWAMSMLASPEFMYWLDSQLGGGNDPP